MRSKSASYARRAIALMTPLMPILILVVVQGRRW